MSLDSASDCHERGREELMNGNFDTAIDEFTAAIDLEDDENDQTAIYYLDRCSAYIKLNKFAEALSDAQKSLQIKPKNKNAHFRAATASWGLKEFESAKKYFTQARELGQKKCDLWIRKCDAEIEELKSPSPPVVHIEPMDISSTSSNNTPAKRGASAAPSSSSSSAPSKPKTKTSLSKIRTSHIQSTKSVQLTIFCKGLKRDDVAVEFGTDTVLVKLQLASGDTYENAWHLFGSIDPTKCKVKVNPYKVQLVLQKTGGAEWKSLERAGKPPPNVQERQNTYSDTNSTSYPSSGKKKIDWDTLDKENADAEKSETPEGDAALNKLFQDIYKGADPDTRRAMIKSFQTSGGTVLSTNWGEVAKSDYEKEIRAPDGQEVHKWND